MKLFLSRGAAAAITATLFLLALPSIAVAEFGQTESFVDDVVAQAQADNPEMSPEFFTGATFEFYPLLLNNVAGYDSLLAVSNLLDTVGIMDICVVPAGTSQFQCTNGIAIGGRQTLFFSAGVGALNMLQNNTGQVFIFAGPNTFGTSMAFILDQGGQGLTAIIPFSFN